MNTLKDFNEICKQFEPMITSVLKKAHVYKDYEHYRQCARIALWKAWKNFDPSKGDLAPYAYKTMLTSIYTEMAQNNRYSDHHIAYEKEELMNLTQFQQENTPEEDVTDQLEELLSRLSEEECKLLTSLYIMGKTYEEIAASEGKTVVSLKKRRQRIMNKLRAMLKDN